jgi:hypothetical protein
MKKPNALEKKATGDARRKATFVAEPFERGVGLTLGNSLRGALSSSLQGAAAISPGRGCERREAVPRDLGFHFADPRAHSPRLVRKLLRRGRVRRRVGRCRRGRRRPCRSMWEGAIERARHRRGGRLLIGWVNSDRS